MFSLDKSGDSWSLNILFCIAVMFREITFFILLLPYFFYIIPPWCTTVQTERLSHTFKFRNLVPFLSLKPFMLWNLYLRAIMVFGLYFTTFIYICASVKLSLRVKNPYLLIFLGLISGMSFGIRLHWVLTKHSMIWFSDSVLSHRIVGCRLYMVLYSSIVHSSIVVL